MSRSGSFVLALLTTSMATQTLGGCWLGRSNELWKSDGTPAGTVRVKRLPPRYWLPWMHPVPVGNDVFFSLANRDTMVLSKSDGTAQGTKLVKDFGQVAPGGGGARDTIAAVGTTLFLSLRDEEHGEELWKSDGTPEGTILVEDLVPGPGSSSPRQLVAVRGRLFFAVGLGEFEDFIEPGLWTSDGTAAGTYLLKAGYVGLGDSVAVGDSLFFLSGASLWRTDGTPAGTTKVKDLPSGRGSGPCIVVERTLYFPSGDELWKSDGTPAGTMSVRRLPGWKPWTWDYLGGTYGKAGERFVFVVSREDGPHQLWASDGTPDGTVMLRQYPRDTSEDRLDGPPSRLTSVGKRVFFAAYEMATGEELWMTDGTPEGTVLVKDLRPGPDSSEPMDLVAVRGELLVSPRMAAGLWKTDGTGAGTMRILPYGVSNPAEAGGWAYWLHWP